jgi:hypothetical protein
LSHVAERGLGPGPVQPTSGGHGGDSKRLGCLSGRQTLPGDKQEHLALSLGQLDQRHLKLLPARAGIKALVDRVPVDGSDLVLRDRSQ